MGVVDWRLMDKWMDVFMYVLSLDSFYRLAFSLIPFRISAFLSLSNSSFLLSPSPVSPHRRILLPLPPKVDGNGTCFKNEWKKTKEYERRNKQIQEIEK